MYQEIAEHGKKTHTPSEYYNGGRAGERQSMYRFIIHLRDPVDRTQQTSGTRSGTASRLQVERKMLQRRPEALSMLDSGPHRPPAAEPCCALINGLPPPTLRSLLRLQSVA